MVKYQIGRLFFCLSQINREERIQKMKEYNFPNIFHNIVGQVIPNCAFSSRDPLIQYNRRRSIDNERLLMNNNLQKKQIQSRNNLKVKSFKKQLLRRSKCFQTMTCFTNRNVQKNIENIRQTQVQSKFSNYLKKNQTITLNNRTNSNNTNNLRFSQETEVRVAKKSDLKYFNKANRKGKRIKTSLQNDNKVAQILKAEFNPDSKVNIDYRQSQNEVNYKVEDVKLLNQLNQKEKESTNKIQNVVIQDMFRKKVQRSIRKNSIKQVELIRKKTVNFIISSQEIVSDQNQHHVKKQNEHNQTKNLKKSGIYKLNKNNSNFSRKSSNKSNKSKSNNDNSDEWTNRSVVSIKFTDNDSIKQGKSLRSEQSILNSQQSLRFKSNKMSLTKTFKHLNLVKKQMKLKRHKSQNKLISKGWQANSKQPQNIKKSSTKYNDHSSKSIKSIKSIKTITRKNFNKGQKKIGPRVSLLKKVQPLSIKEVLFDGCNAVLLKDSSTFQANVYKKNNSRKILKNTRSDDDKNVFNQLNNFHKFLKEHDVIDSEREIKKAFAQPIVIPDETNYRTFRVNKTSITNQNLYFDMGLQLIKKMNVLAQKKI